MHLQINKPQMQSWLCFDVDQPTAAFDWYDQQAPTPNCVIQNPENGHAHIIYGLQTPVCTSVNGRMKPQRYLNAIEMGLRDVLKGDKGYTGLIVKNPLRSDFWRVWTPRSDLYSLDELFDYCPSTCKASAATSVTVAGRNCDLFDRLRRFAYKRVLEARKTGSANSWLATITAAALSMNEYPIPLSFNEIASIARSVSKWTWTNYERIDSKNRGVMGLGNARRREDDVRLTDTEIKQRQKAGAEYVNNARKADTEAAIKKAIGQLRLDGKRITKASVAKLSGVHRNTLSRYYSDLF